MIWRMSAPGGTRLALLRLGVLVVSLVISLAVVEGALHVRYQRSMLATLGGPGPHFAGRRGRLDEAEKTAGVPRLMILGDSITFGQGLADDADPWPEQLARRYEREQKRVEMAVYAWPGRDIDMHERQFAASAHRVVPDAFVYQWFVNDIENSTARPDNRRWWQRTAVDGWLKRHSYLYFLIDSRLTRLLPPLDRSYVQYLLDDYRPGGLEWERFELAFHNLAARVDETGPRARLLVLYPVLPFRGAYPLQPIHDAMRELAGPHRFDFAAATLVRQLGGAALQRDADGRERLRLPAAGLGPAIGTPAFYPTRQPLDVVLTLTAAVDAPREVCRVDLIDDAGKAIGSAPVIVDNDHPVDAVVHLDAGGMTGRYVSLLVHKTAPVSVDVSGLALQVDYGFSVVDPTPALAGFDTHVNVYDAHPNARAQQIVADAVYDALKRFW